MKGQRHILEWLGQGTMYSKLSKFRKEMVNGFFKVLFQHSSGDIGVICGTSNSRIPGKLDMSKK